MKHDFEVGDYVNLNPLAICVDAFETHNQYASDLKKMGDGDGENNYSEILTRYPFGRIVDRESHVVYLDGVTFKVYKVRWAETLKDIDSFVSFNMVEYICENALLPNSLPEKVKVTSENTITPLNLDL